MWFSPTRSGFNSRRRSLSRDDIKSVPHVQRMYPRGLRARSYRTDVSLVRIQSCVMRGMAQRKRAWLITTRSQDRNLLPRTIYRGCSSGVERALCMREAKGSIPFISNFLMASTSGDFVPRTPDKLKQGSRGCNPRKIDLDSDKNIC